MKKFAILSVVIFLAIIGFFATNISSQQKNDLTNAFNESIALEGQGKLKEAAALLEPFAEPYKDNYLLQLRLGYLYYLTDNNEKSIKHYELAVKLQPSSVEALLGLRLPYAKSNNWAKAEELYNKVLKLDPNNREANLRLGQIYYYNGLAVFEKGFDKAKPLWEKSKNYLNKIISLYPSDYEANLSYGYTMYALGFNDVAKKHFNAVLMMNKEDSLAVKGLNLIK